MPTTDTFSNLDVSLSCLACLKNTYKLSASQCEVCPNNSQTAGTGNEKAGCLCISGYQGPAGGPCIGKAFEYFCFNGWYLTDKISFQVQTLANMHKYIFISLMNQNVYP